MYFVFLYILGKLLILHKNTFLSAGSVTVSSFPRSGNYLPFEFTKNCRHFEFWKYVQRKVFDDTFVWTFIASRIGVYNRLSENQFFDEILLEETFLEDKVLVSCCRFAKQREPLTSLIRDLKVIKKYESARSASYFDYHEKK